MPIQTDWLTDWLTVSCKVTQTQTTPSTSLIFHNNSANNDHHHQEQKSYSSIRLILRENYNKRPNLNVYVNPIRWFESRLRLGIFLLTTASRPALGSTYPPIQWVPGALSLGVKWRGVKPNAHLHLAPRPWMRGAIPPLPNTLSWRGSQLKESTGTTLPYLSPFTPDRY
jgi:hypothetical protein